MIILIVQPTFHNGEIKTLLSVNDVSDDTNLFKMNKRIFLLFLLLGLVASSMYGQRRGTTYQALLMRTDQPSTYFDHVIFPESDNTAQFTLLFRMDYDSVPFMKKKADMRAPDPENEYYGPVQIGLEIYEGAAGRSRRSDASNSIFRDNWQDTLWTDTYEKTKSRTDHTQGILKTTLEPGEYHYEIQFPHSNMPMAGNRSSGSPQREMTPPKRNVSVTGIGGAENADFILLKNYEAGENSFSGTFLNYGDNILYGEDYSVLIRIPSEAAGNGNSLNLQLYRLTGGGNSDSQELRHSEEIDTDQLIQLGKVRFTNSDSEIGFEAELSEDGASYAYVDIPNNDFENSSYKLTLEEAGAEEAIGEKIIRSQWLDMPVSLYNLNVAIEMLHFMISDDELRRINSGSDAERERKFREFWAERDPTPNTEYNELMTEYYGRIDQAYERFSSLQVPGYETDQGQAYIIYGPPDDVERRLPAGAPTREIWHYPNRTLIFEATTGFGDFKLVSEEQS